MSNGNESPTILESLGPGDEIGPPNRRFLLERKLGGGGMGQVWLARDLTEERLEGGRSRKALKLVLPTLQNQPEALDNLKREALRAARLQHPNIINVIGFEDGENGFPFIVMEYLDGETLAQRLAREGERGFPAETVLDWLGQIVAGLDHAHREGIIHRDLKPGNIMLLKRGGLKILDFGLAYRLRRTASTMNLPPVLTGGTAQYMPPETAIYDERPHKRQDLYAVACIGWELLTGAPPFSPEAARMGPERGYPARPEGMSQRVYETLVAGFTYEARKRPDNVARWFGELKRAMRPGLGVGSKAALVVLLMAAIGAGWWWRDQWRAASSEETPPTVVTVVDEAAVKEAEAARRAAARAERERQAEAERRAAAEQQLAEEQAARERQSEEQAALAARLAELEAAARNQETTPPATPALPPVVSINGWEEAAVKARQRETAAVLDRGVVFYDRLSDGTTGPAMVVIPSGKFMMGSPRGETGRDDDEKHHEVSIDKPFGLAQHETTVGEFRRFVEVEAYETDAERGEGCWAWSDDGSEWQIQKDRNWKNPGFEQTDNDPVVCVSWNDAMAYVNWLNKMVGEAVYRLPTEAQWEYAVRAGTETARYWGDDPDAACNHANVADRSTSPAGRFWTEKHDCDDGHWFPAPVKTYRPNRFGLYDMLGNVWEWTCSGYDSGYQGGEQDCISNNSASSPRSLRGGSWDFNPRRVRSADRSCGAPAVRNDIVGVRLARSLTL